MLTTEDKEGRELEYRPATWSTSPTRDSPRGQIPQDRPLTHSVDTIIIEYEPRKQKVHAQVARSPQQPTLLATSSSFSYSLPLSYHHSTQPRTISPRKNNPKCKKQTYLPLRPLPFAFLLRLPLAFLRRALRFGLDGEEPIQSSLLFAVQVFLEFICSFSDTFFAVIYANKLRRRKRGRLLT